MRKILFLLILLCPTLYSFAQDTRIDELRLSLNQDGSRYLKWTILNQTWLRFNESNPQTTVLGEASPNTFDIGLRRTRIQFFGQLSDHVFFYTQFGQNNFNFLSQNAGNRKLQVFFHDAVAEYKIFRSNESMKIGTGLTIANGLSRFTQPSISSIMTMDVPVFAQATVDQTDEFSRKLSLYIRGQIRHVDYRVVVSDPFPVTTNGQAKQIIGSNAMFAQTGHSRQYQGLLIYNIFDKEPHTTPYMTGTYLGKKRVLNLEAGFIHQRKATETGTTDPVTGLVGDVTFHDMNLWSVAAYYDAPISREKGSCVSSYLGYFGLDYGPGYLRYNGIMNPADGIANGPAPGSQGNSFPMFGSGNVLYGQLGYLFRRDMLGTNNGTLMPYVTVMHANFDRIRDTMDVINMGTSWLISGHNSKLTLDFQHRPVYESVLGNLEKRGARNQVVLQFQVFI